MTIHEAYDVLYQHQEWRCGVEDVPMVEPHRLSDAITIVLKFLHHKLQETDALVCQK
jgi:hypothetical protein